MKKTLPVVCSLVAVLTLVGGAHAGFFTEEWSVLDTGFNARNMGWDGTYVFLGESTSTPGSLVYNASDGTDAGFGLDMTGLTFGSLGFFAQTANADGKIFAYSNSDPPELKVWDSITDTPYELNWGGGFARNFFAVGDRIYSTGSANGGPITINEPDPVSGDYVAIYSFGDGGAGEPGGKAGVTAMQDASMVWGSEAISGAGFDGIHQWSYDAGNDEYVYDGDYIFPAAETPLGDGLLYAMDVAVDEDDNLLFAIEHYGSAIFAINLGTTAVGDETIVASYDVGVDLTYYGSLDIDMANNALYWMGRGATNQDASFGKLTYIPEPSALGLLVLGGLALLRRR
jgi:hypothetical protein